jgi:two-component system chemotaxis response regulator CheY
VPACTPEGVRASNDAASTLAAGFREVLRAVNGKRTVADLYAFLPQLDRQKVDIWLDDALRMDLIKRTAPAIGAAPLPGAAFEYGAYIESDAEVAALAKDISKWVKEKPQAAVRARVTDLAKTVSMATLESGAALQTLADTGVFTSDMNSSSPPVDMLAEMDARDARDPPPRAAPAGQKRVALIVEDDLPDLGSLAGLLGAAGYEIRATATRKQFVDELNHPRAPDLIFLKLGSKVIDAFKTLDKIRQHPVLKQVAIVITGEKPSREEIAKSILLGASGWVLRPYTSEKITAALNGALPGMN